MELPSDPVILLSLINTKLRDFYPTLDILCDELDIEKDSVILSLRTIGCEYDPVSNRFQ